jgi:hypothetical protein
MSLLLIVGALLIGCFGFVLLFGAPYLPTLRPQVSEGLDMLDLKAGQTMLELGCGDGQVLRAAAKRGWNCVGYELNPLLALLCWLRTRRYGKRVRIVWGNFWQADWPPADGIYGFILQRQMSKLDKKIMQYPSRPIKLVSFAFTIQDRPHKMTRHGLYLYEYR